jgi:hypothetical protein
MKNQCFSIFSVTADRIQAQFCVSRQIRHRQAPAKAENILPRESKTAISNCHGISVQGLLGLDTRKSEQRLYPFYLDFVCLDQNSIIEGSYWLQIFTCGQI